MSQKSVLTKKYPSLSAVCHAVVKNAPSGLDAKTVASFMDKPYQTLMSELSRQDGHKFGADLVLPLMHIAASDEPLHFLAREMGGVYVALPANCNLTHQLTQQCMKVVAEFGDMMKATGQALEDGIISKDERDNITSKAHEVLTEIMSLLTLIKQ